MKKKLLTILLTVFALSTCMFTLTACNHEHSYTMEVIEPTCLNLGYNKYTCKCGNTYNDNFVNSLGHSFTNYISDNNATFDADGTKTATCDRDGCNQTDTITDEGNKLIPSQGLEFALNADQQSYSVTGLGTCTDTILVIPSTYQNKPVTSIGMNAFGDCDSLTSIEIPNSVTSIGNQAFYNCDSLTSIEIPNSVTSIGNYAFYDCDSLTNITIPNSVTSIGYGTFRNCFSLTSIEIPNSVTSIGNYAFENCDSLTSIVIPNSVTSIGNYVFSGCDSLIYNIKDNLKYLGNSSNPYIYLAGVEDKSITTATIDSNCKFIGDRAFDYCNSLTSIEIPNSVTSIGFNAFRGCSSLTSVTFADTTTWYTTLDFNDWENKTGGTQISVTTPSTNATYFKSTYNDYFWYKL